MEKDKRENIDIMDKLLMAFDECPPKVRKIVSITILLIMILQFFSISNRHEASVALICLVIFMVLSFKQGKYWKVLKATWAFLIIINCLITPFIGSPFGGVFSDENIQSRKEERFYEGFANGLYYLSLENYDKALKSFKRIEGCIPDEYIKEYYLWYGETAMYAGHNDIGVSILEKLEIKNIVYNDSDKKVVFQYLPICKMLNFLNYEDYNSLKEMAVQYQNTNEQIFVLFELAAICLDDKVDENENRIEQLIEIYAELSDTFEEFDHVKYGLLARCATGLSEKYPEYSMVLLAELFEESESFFFETFLYHYVKENNLMNIRWISLDYLTRIRNIYEKGWMNYKKEENTNLKKYSDKIIKLGYYLGSEEVLKENLRVQKVAAGKYEGYELYNVVPFSENKFLGVFLETLEVEDKESIINDMNMAAEAHVCSLTLNGNVLEVEPIIVDNQEFTKNVLMSKLFIIEQTGLDGKYLVASINGTGEYLNLQVLDVKNNTCVELENIGEIYHASGYEFDGEKSYVVDYEIDNNIDANMERKVGRSVIAEIDYSQNAVSKKLKYSDPAVEFYDEERNEALVFPLENLNRLDGRQIKSKVLLEKIRQNSTPYYKYSSIQQSYTFFMEAAGCNLSGITVVYDANTEHEASFFFCVRREQEKVKLLGIYEILDDRLKSVY